MLSRPELLFLGACTLRAAHPEWSVDLCLAHADDLLRAAERGTYPDQFITLPADVDPWAAPSQQRPQGAEVPV